MKKIDICKPFKIISAVAAVSALISCKPSILTSENNDSKVKIVNGTEVSKSDPIYSSSVTLGFCTGSVLDQNWILTAAHCVASKSGRARTGVVVEFKGSSYEASKILVHPEYNGRNRVKPNDIALINLRTPIKDAQPVSLATNVKYSVGDEVILAGFGVTGKEAYAALDSVEARFVSVYSKSTDSASTELWNTYLAIKGALKKAYANYEKVARSFSYNTATHADVERVRESYHEFSSERSELEIFLINVGYLELENDKVYQNLIDKFKNVDNGASFGTLRKTSTNISEIAPTMILYESQNGLNSSCKGDSGGPMFIETSKGFVQIGVTHAVSYSVPGSLGQCHGGGAYTRVSAYTDFINSRFN